MPLESKICPSAHPGSGLTTRVPMTAAWVAGVQDLASFVAMITLVPVLFLLAVLKVGRIAQFLSRAGCHNRLAEGTEFTDAQGRRRCARPFELTEHAGMTLRLARDPLCRDCRIRGSGWESPAKG